MKKYIPALLATVLCMASGCDTSIPNDEITEHLNDDFRCSATGGILFTQAQADVIKSMIDMINNNCVSDNGELIETNQQDNSTGIVRNCKQPANSLNLTLAAIYGDTTSPDFDNIGYNSAKSAIDRTIKSVRASLQDSMLLYNTKPMLSIYECVRDNVSYGSGVAASKTYCACGYEFCESGTSCTNDSTGEKLQVCAATKSVETNNDNSNIECEPVLVKDSAVADAVAKSTYRLMWKASSLKGAFDSNLSPLLGALTPCALKDNANSNDNKTICADASNNSVGYLLNGNTCSSNQLNCILTASIFSYLVNCMNYSEIGQDTVYNTNTMSLDEYAQELASKLPQFEKDTLVEKHFKGRTVYLAGATPYPVCIGDEIPFSTKMRPGATNSGFYFNMFRSISKELINNYNNEKKPLTGDDLEAAVDDFLIMVATSIYNQSKDFLALDEVSNLLSNTLWIDKDSNTACVRAKDSDKCDPTIENNIIANTTILNGMKIYFNKVYTSTDPLIYKKADGTEFRTSLSQQEMARLFYATLTNITLYASEGSYSKLNSSFSVNLQCTTPESGIGDPAGLKKYCSANESQDVGMKQILDGLNASSNDYARDKLVDIITMGAIGTIPIKINEKAYDITINGDVNATSNRIGFALRNDEPEDNEANADETTPEYLKGKWLAMRCPGGTSCTTNGQCGVCANSEIRQTLYQLVGEDNYTPVPNSVCRNGKIVDPTVQSQQ